MFLTKEETEQRAQKQNSSTEIDTEELASQIGRQRMDCAVKNWCWYSWIEKSELETIGFLPYSIYTNKAIIMNSIKIL